MLPHPVHNCSGSLKNKPYTKLKSRHLSKKTADLHKQVCSFLAGNVRSEKITRTQISCHDKRQWRRKVCWVCVIFHSLMNYGGHERRSRPLLPLFTRRPSPHFCQGLGGTDSNKSVENVMIYRSIEPFRFSHRWRNFVRKVVFNYWIWSWYHKTKTMFYQFKILSSYALR